MRNVRLARRYFGALAAGSVLFVACASEGVNGGAAVDADIGGAGAGDLASGGRVGASVAGTSAGGGGGQAEQGGAAHENSAGGISGDGDSLDGAGAGGARQDSGGSAGQAAFDPCPIGKRCAILPLGDSITYGYGSTDGSGYRGPLFASAVAAGKSLTFVGSQSSGPSALAGKSFPRANEGHSGYSIDDSNKTSGIAPLTGAAIAQYQPNIVLLMIGTNDMHYSLDLANAPARLGALMDQIVRGAPNALLVVAQIVAANGAQDTSTRTYNAAIPELVAARAEQGKHVAMVNMYSALGTWSFTNFKDSEHPNDTGYALMAQTWYESLRNFLK